MTIRNLARYVASLWDWAFLTDALNADGGRIAVTDVDGLVEVNRHFLFIEAKAAGKPVPMGQAILFNRLIEEPNKSVITLRGEPGAPVSMQHWPHPEVPCTVEDIVAFVYEWASAARRTG